MISCTPKCPAQDLSQYKTPQHENISQRATTNERTAQKHRCVNHKRRRSDSGHYGILVLTARHCGLLTDQIARTQRLQLQHARRLRCEYEQKNTEAEQKSNNKRDCCRT